MQWKHEPIDGCTVRPLTRYTDPRGWLGEFFRNDELPPALHPAMGYLSLTVPGVARGPHEHRDQTDLFLFFSGRFKVYLWDAREASGTYGRRMVFEAGDAEPTIVLVPPGVVHAYRNVGDRDALVVNCPNRLYAGEGKKGPVDEIRHEQRDDSAYTLD